MKKAIIILTLIVLGFIGVNFVKADSETFSLTMGTVEYFYSETRRYVEGNFFVDMSFDSWYNSSCTSGKAQVTLYQSGVTRALGSVKPNIVINSSYYHRYGYYDNTAKYYEFRRESCGWRSKRVTIGS